MVLKFRESEKQIQRMVETAIAKEINKKVKEILPKVRAQMTPIIMTALATCPEMLSLKNGVLRAEFGIRNDPTPQLLAAIMSTLQYKQLYAQRGRGGGIQVVMQPSDYSNLFTQGFSEQKIRDGSLPWLRWLLTFGDSIIITGFGVEFGNFKGKASRTGKAVMSDELGPYKVNSAFSGTVNDNFITRAVERTLPQLIRVFRSVL